MRQELIIKRLTQAGAVSMLGLLLIGANLRPALSSETIEENTCVSFSGISAVTPSLKLYGKNYETEKSPATLTTKEEAAQIEETSAELIELENPFYGYEDISATRQMFVKVATSFEGRIPYVWGAKMTSSDSYNPTKSGLDCSGFVQYIYYFITDQVNSSLGSTYAISNAFTPISKDELKPGDIGVIRLDGSYYTLPTTDEKFYQISDAEAYMSSYNDYLREISWEEEEYEEEVVRTVKVEVEVDENNNADSSTGTIVYDSDDPMSSSMGDSDEAPSTPIQASSSENGEKKTKIITKKIVEYETKTRMVSTLNEDDLLTNSDLKLKSNHVGIYVGTDADGNQIWCHCAGRSFGNTVVVGKYAGFQYYFSIL